MGSAFILQPLFFKADVGRSLRSRSNFLVLPSLTLKRFFHLCKHKSDSVLDQSLLNQTKALFYSWFVSKLLLLLQYQLSLAPNSKLTADQKNN